MSCTDGTGERGRDPLTAEQLVEITAHLGVARPATTDLILSIGQSIAERREHEHPRLVEDFFCANLSGWMGDRMPTVLRRLLDAEADNAQLRARIAELETYARGCDAEGCVQPHSSWCEQAKAYAADHDGCTCGRPWEGHPQPHAMYCWSVSPPRDEVERMTARVAELEALAADATEYRVLLPDGSGAELRVSRSTTGRTAGGWAVAVPGWGGGRAWTREGWQDSISALTVDRLFCWPDAVTAIAEARRALAEDGEQRA